MLPNQLTESTEPLMLVVVVLQAINKWFNEQSCVSLWTISSSSDTIDQAVFFLLLFVHSSIQSRQKLSKDHRWCLRTKNKNTVRIKKGKKQNEYSCLCSQWETTRSGFTFTNSAWARKGNFLSALPLKPLLFLQTQKDEPWAAGCQQRDCCSLCTERAHTHMPTCYKRLYSQSDVPQVQAVFRHLALSEPHRLQLKDGEQLLSWVDDLTLQGMKTLRFMPCEIWQWWWIWITQTKNNIKNYQVVRY